MRVAGLFAGIGGFEHGFQCSGHSTILLCENDPYATAVLRKRFSDVEHCADVACLDALPKETEVVTAGFPCQNLSMAGDKLGIDGPKSGVIDHLFRLLDKMPAPWVVIENVYFMLHLNKGAAMTSILDRLEARNYRWAYRVVDSRAFGLPQRRRRVFVVASNTGDPRNVLLGDDAPDIAWPQPSLDRPIGFYWTEGRSGSGLTGDAIPPLKAGSHLGIPSPPAVLLPNGRVVTPTIEAAERLQGFPARWSTGFRRQQARHRWRLVGNAVSVPVAQWIGRRLNDPARYEPEHDVPLRRGMPWPKAGWNNGDGTMISNVSELPVRKRRGRLSAFNSKIWPNLSERALRGFVTRARTGGLAYPDGFLDALDEALDYSSRPSAA